MCRHADAELDLLLTEAVPPVDLSRVGVFRAPMSKHAKQAGGFGVKWLTIDRWMMPRRRRQTSDLDF